MTKGVVRSIDALGRIVIPKEYRKVLGIQSNDRLELILDDSVIEIRKYDLNSEFIKIQNIYYKMLYSTYNGKVIFFDRENIYFYNKKKKLKTSLYFNNFDFYNEPIYIDNKLNFGDMFLDGYFIFPVLSNKNILGYVAVSTDKEEYNQIVFINKLINNC